MRLRWARRIGSLRASSSTDVSAPRHRAMISKPGLAAIKHYDMALAYICAVSSASALNSRHHVYLSARCADDRCRYFDYRYSRCAYVTFMSNTSTRLQPCRDAGRRHAVYTSPRFFSEPAVYSQAPIPMITGFRLIVHFASEIFALRLDFASDTTHHFESLFMLFDAVQGADQALKDVLAPLRRSPFHMPSPELSPAQLSPIRRDTGQFI